MSTTGPYTTPAPSDGGRHTSESRVYRQVSLPSMCLRRHQSRSKLPVHQMYWMGACEMFQYRRNKDWTCDPCSALKTQQSTPPPTSAPYAEQICDDSTFNVLQFNAIGIGNKLTELGVVLERNKVKVAVIQESKLSSKSKNPCIRNYTTVRKDRPHGHGGGLLILIHESISFFKPALSPEALSDPHLEELTIIF